VADVSTAAAETGRRLPGKVGIWVLVAADLVIFAVLFASFMQERSANLGLFDESRRALSPTIGGINTLILLTSSWCVVLAVHAAKDNQLREVQRWLAGGALCGFAFMVSKAVEYTGKISAGITMGSNPFYMWYYSLTGLHLAHVIVGTVVLILLRGKARSGSYNEANRVGLEMGATFWHMVDLLWVMLFSLLYLMR